MRLSPDEREMTIELEYGQTDVLRLELSADALLLDGSLPRGTPLADPAAAARAALSSPIEFPPLSSAVVPGDRIAVAVDRGVAQVAPVVAAVVEAVLEGGAIPKDVSLLLPPGSSPRSQALATSALPPAIRDSVRVAVHDPNNQRAHCYLAAAKDGKPIYFNRTIFDADLVVPVGTLRLDDAFGYGGVHSGLFPVFSDRSTRSRFCLPSGGDWAARRQRYRQETEEAAWLLGVQFTVQVNPGPNGSALQVLAGEARAVARQGRPLCEAAWKFSAPRRASLVIAAITGGPGQQTWENFGRALYAASRAVTDGGTIVLCTALHGTIGPALKCLASLDTTRDNWQQSLRRERSDDARSAWLLAETLQHVQVFLLSQLPGDEVEDLGVGHIEHAGAIQHLTRHCNSCIVMGGAQYAIPSVANE
jgi:nickel-dependent lactate racemase